MSDIVQQSQDLTPMDIRVDKLAFGVREPCEVHVFVNHSLFIIKLSPGPDPSKSIEANYINRLDAAQESENFQEQYLILKEIEQFVVDLCQPTFQELAPILNYQELKRTLQACLAPDTTMLELVTVDGTARIRPGDAPPHPYRSRTQDVAVSRKDLPIFRPSEIIVLPKLRSTRVLKVLVDEQLMCYKLPKACYPDLARELHVLQDILEAGLDPSFRIPRLRGFIRSEDESGLIGFLMDYIETDPDIADLSRLRGRIHTIDMPRRAKWVSQAEEIIRGLHDIRVIWGDAKADNLLVDSHDNVWLIDLGGGRTDGWVTGYRVLGQNPVGPYLPSVLWAPSPP